MNSMQYLNISTLLLLCLATACADPGTNVAETNEDNTANSTEQTSEDLKEDRKIILFFGNSLTSGYGVDSEESFPSLIQARIDSLDLPYEVVNAGVSGETTAAGLNRLGWVLERQAIDIFILELGANDGLRGLPPEQTRHNLVAMIAQVRKANPEVTILLAGMMVPPSMGPDYSAEFNRIFPEIAKSENVALIPFLLENVGGVAGLNQPDGIHPNPEGNLIVRENVWKELKKMLK